MRSSLEPYLRRAVSDDELAAVITVWRRDGRLGMARVADTVMREAFTRFGSEIPDRAMQARIRRRIARQWFLAAQNFALRRHPLEAAKYLAHGVRWLVAR